MTRNANSFTRPTAAQSRVFSMLRLMNGSAPADQCGNMNTLNALVRRHEIRLFEHNGRLWVEEV